MSNCKVGDIAEVISSEAGNVGKYVVVNEWAGIVPGYAGCDRWLVTSLSGPLTTIYEDTGIPARFISNSVRDSRLRPIKGIPPAAVDQSKAWLPPVPQKEVA